MKYQKGVTLSEILVSIVLISIIMVLLFQLLITLRGDDILNQAKSELLVIENTLTNDIQGDIFGIGINYIYVSNTNCTSNADTSCCCTMSESNYCIKLFFSNEVVGEIDIYSTDIENDSIRYNYTNGKLAEGLSFGTPSVIRTSAYKGSYRFDTLSIVIIPINGLDDDENIKIIAPSLFDDGEVIRDLCP